MLKLFISYSHKDETLVSKFISHMSPLQNTGIIEGWYDRKLLAGESFQEDIDNSLDKADVICLMISDSFLSSKACMEEKVRALELRAKKGIRVVPVILSHCAWDVHKEISSLLAVPTDGKPISSFKDQDEAWLDVVNWLKKICKSITTIRKLEISDDFNYFLNSADILSKSHKNKETLNLDDIFVFPKLKYYDDEEVAHAINVEHLKEKLLSYDKIIIAGENQSGKTTLCKVLYKAYRELGYVPVYLEDDNKFLGNPLYKISNAFSEQYKSVNITDIESRRIVPIVDNFHSAKHQEKYTEQFKDYNKQILIVDDIFGLNIRNQNRIKEYNKFKIREFSATERNELISRWINIKEHNAILTNQNHLQQSVDEKTELIENSLGKIFGKGIMPSYPFFILSLLAAQDTQKPLDSEITSQGHCYQALIYLYLRKQGVTNDHIDVYTNFLTELAYYIYNNNGNSLNDDEFQIFLKEYKQKYNLPISSVEILQTLSKVNICKYNSFNQFNFCYLYIYYFFVAKHLSENVDKQKALINGILSNLHKDENAYITIFIAHHTKSDYVLDELLLNAEMLFEKFQPSTLDKNELSIFDKNEDKIIKAVLPTFTHNAEEERQKLLEVKSKREEELDEKLDEEKKADTNNSEYDQIAEEFAMDLRLSVKTVEVMGLIIKNRSGSLNKERLEYMFEQGMKVHLRVLKSFIELIKDERAENDIVDFIIERVNHLKNEEEEENRELSLEKIKKLAKTIYWNINFGVLHGFITKAIHSLGSSNLLNVSQKVCDKLDTPASFIVNQGIRMWYAKNLRLDEIVTNLKKDNFSVTAQNLLKYKIVEHCRMHKIDYKDLQKIEQKLHIPSAKMRVDK